MRKQMLAMVLLACLLAFSSSTLAESPSPVASLTQQRLVVFEMFSSG